MCAASVWECVQCAVCVCVRVCMRAYRERTHPAQREPPYARDTDTSRCFRVRSFLGRMEGTCTHNTTRTNKQHGVSTAHNEARYSRLSAVRWMRCVVTMHAAAFK